jgi:hypothetical protein
MPALPRAILFDLDDTLIRAYAQPRRHGRDCSTSSPLTSMHTILPPSSACGPP